MTTHTEYQNSLNDYLDHSLNDRETSELFAHLAGCAECRLSLNAMMRVRDHFRSLETEEVSRTLDRRVLISVAAARTQSRRRSWYAPVWFTRVSIPLPAAASIVFLIILASLLATPLFSRTSDPQISIPTEILLKISPSQQRPF